MSLKLALTTELNGRRSKADPYMDHASPEFSFRARRFQAVEQLIARSIRQTGKCRIVDLGGTEKYWRIGESFIAANRGKIEITLLNVESQTPVDDETFR